MPRRFAHTAESRSVPDRDNPRQSIRAHPPLRFGFSRPPELMAPNSGLKFRFETWLAHFAARSRSPIFVPGCAGKNAILPTRRETDLGGGLPPVVDSAAENCCEGLRRCKP